MSVAVLWSATAIIAASWKRKGGDGDGRGRRVVVLVLALLFVICVVYMQKVISKIYKKQRERLGSHTVTHRVMFILIIFPFCPSPPLTRLI
jgi:hypothetical protein